MPNRKKPTKWLILVLIAFILILGVILISKKGGPTLIPFPTKTSDTSITTPELQTITGEITTLNGDIITIKTNQSTQNYFLSKTREILKNTEGKIVTVPYTELKIGQKVTLLTGDNMTVSSVIINK